MYNLGISSYKKIENINFIDNEYNFLNKLNTFNYIIYFLENYKCRITIINFNNLNEGWKNEIILKIYDYEKENFEIITLGTSKKNHKIINIKTNIKLIEKNSNEISNEIPKKIFQTYNNNNFHNISHYQAYQSLLKFNPGYEYYFFNDIECRDFIKNNYNENILNTYDKLYPCAYKADLFRYLIIYKYGGIYIDNKYLVRKSFSSFISIHEKNVYTKDIKDNLLFNSLLISIPNEDNYKLLIENIVNNVKSNFYGKCPLHPTGPRLFYEYFKNENIKLQHKINNNNKNYLNCYIQDNSNNIILNTSYEGYYFNKNHRNKLKNDYDFCYRNKLIYVQNYLVINHYKFSILNIQKINFNIIITEENEKFIKINLKVDQVYLKFMNNKNSKFIFINDITHKQIEFDLINVVNKIFTIYI